MIILRSQREIDVIRESSRIDRLILEEVISHVKPGITTQELNDIAVALMQRHGAKSATIGYKGYPKHICVSINEEVVHGIPGGRVILDGDMVSIDVCIEKDGYYGDCAETIALGEVGDEKLKLLEAGRESLLAAIEKAVPENRIGDISHAIESTATGMGYSVVREFTGHGIGTSMHEDPQIPNYGRAGTGYRIKPGMVFAIEVMINAGTWETRVLDDDWTVVTADGKLSVHFENTVAVTNEGNEVLTCLKKK